MNTDKLVASCDEFQALHEAAILIQVPYMVLFKLEAILIAFVQQKVFRGYRTRKSLAGANKMQEIVQSTSFEVHIKIQIILCQYRLSKLFFPTAIHYGQR